MRATPALTVFFLLLLFRSKAVFAGMLGEAMRQLEPIFYLSRRRKPRDGKRNRGQGGKGGVFLLEKTTRTLTVG